MEPEDQTIAFWRAELRRLLAACTGWRLQAIGQAVRPVGDCLYGEHPVLNWPWRGRLRYRIDGRWRWLGRLDLGWAGAGTWKERDDREPVHLAKLAFLPGLLLLQRNDQGVFGHILRLRMDDDRPAQAFQAACAAGDQREARLRAAILAALLQAHDHLDAPAPGPSPLVAAALAWIEEHLAAPIDRQVVARALGCHPGHLGRCWRRELGCAFNPWLRGRRLALARHLLGGGDDDLAAIARACGFGSASYLIRRFKAAEGCTPERWRGARGRFRPR